MFPVYGLGIRITATLGLSRILRRSHVRKDWGLNRIRYCSDTRGAAWERIAL